MAKNKDTKPQPKAEEFSDDAKIEVGTTSSGVIPITRPIESVLNVCGKQILHRQSKPMPK